uniref:VPS29 retromer complex component n=1 Tax=Mus musculus TaxID=10090 RepID=H7BXA2_MOUSE
MEICTFRTGATACRPSLKNSWCQEKSSTSSAPATSAPRRATTISRLWLATSTS